LDVDFDRVMVRQQLRDVKPAERRAKAHVTELVAIHAHQAARARRLDDQPYAFAREIRGPIEAALIPHNTEEVGSQARAPISRHRPAIARRQAIRLRSVPAEAARDVSRQRFKRPRPAEANGVHAM
jgi:hypothetical protein